MNDETLKLALEALEYALPSLEAAWYNKSQSFKAQDAITAIKQALAAQPAPVQPVAQYSDIVSDGGLDPRNKFDTPPAAQRPDIDAMIALARANEREACAKVCDRVVEGKDPDDIHSDSQWAALTLAAEIRARGNT